MSATMMQAAIDAVTGSYDDSSDWDAIAPAGGGVPDPDTTISNTTIDIIKSTNYSSDTLTNIPGITFDTTAASTGTFLATQFGGGAIASNATITGDSETDTLNVDIAANQTFNGSALQFSHWTTSDKFEITATGTPTGSGSDITITGTSGNDTINMGSLFDVSDVINGGGGDNILKLSGDYQGGVAFPSTVLQNIQEVILASGNSYGFGFDTGTVAAGQKMIIDGAALGANDDLTLDLNDDTTGSYEVYGGAGTNKIYLNSATDIIHAGTFITSIFSTGILPTTDEIVGAGTTDLNLSGNYSSLYSFTAGELDNVTEVFLATGNNYDLEINHATEPAGAYLDIDAAALTASESFTFDGAHNTTTNFYFTAGAGYDKISGGSGDDIVYFQGNDMLTSSDRIDGGAGSNELELNGDYSAGLKLSSAAVLNMQEIFLFGGHSYNLTMNSTDVTASQTLAVEATGLTATDSLTFKGTKVVGTLQMFGGAGNDTLIGGSGGNQFTGGGGADTMTAGNGPQNFFQYEHTSDSTSTTYDTIIGFNGADNSGDYIQLTGLATPHAVDAAVTTGTLSTSAFDADLSAAIGASQLHAGDAVLFTPNAGGLAGHTFLIVDENGTAGYQAGEDLVIQLKDATNLSDFSLANFIS